MWAWNVADQNPYLGLSMVAVRSSALEIAVIGNRAPCTGVGAEI
jgi:hypothetical protein